MAFLIFLYYISKEVVVLRVLFDSASEGITLNIIIKYSYGHHQLLKKTCSFTNDY